MSDYPEHGKQSAVIEQTNAIGEFLEWLSGQGVQLMVWREDLTDNRPTGNECPSPRPKRAERWPCDPAGEDEGGTGTARWYWMSHCKHWRFPGTYEDGGGQEPGTCCRCEQGRTYEVRGIKAWVHETRTIMQLLADWAGIDLSKIEAEKRQMLEAIRTANGG